MSYEVGVCTWTFGGIALSDICQRLSRLGFDGMELHGDLDLFTPAKVKQLVNDHGLKVLSLTPDNVDFAHPDPEVRAKAMGYYKRLIDFSAELGGPIVSCHGDVGRVAALTTREWEEQLMADNVRILADHAAQNNVELVFEVLNRYESHLINRADQALKLIKDVDSPNLKVLLDAYHMNIEEPSLTRAIEATGNQLGLFHVADSNREGIGYGHTDFDAVFASLAKINYQGAVIVECSARGPNPFTPVKGEGYLDQLELFLKDSLAFIRSK